MFLMLTNNLLAYVGHKPSCVIIGAKCDDPLSPDWVPSIFSHIPATKKTKREKDKERYEQHSRMKNKRVEEKKKKDAVDVLLDLSSVPDAGPAPPAVDEVTTSHARKTLQDYKGSVMTSGRKTVS